MFPLIDETVQKVCQSENDDNLIERITQSIKNLLCPENAEVFTVITSVRNIVRTFGYYSE